MSKVFIDTNIFLRTLIEEDKESFKDCFQLFQNIKTNKLKGITSSVVLSEIAWTLLSYYKFSKLEVVKALRSIVNLRGLSIVDKFQHEIAISLYEKNSIKFIDALIASNPDIFSKQWTIISYDHDFDKIGIKRVEPGQI
ncbi:MAG: PIN domain-containing protein [Candidatus Daviesbacteria bacterium]|nr:PIN domain-containing protein [Candidatus Daviesbacteria bacterium]